MVGAGYACLIYCFLPKLLGILVIGMPVTLAKLSDNCYLRKLWSNIVSLLKLIREVKIMKIKCLSYGGIMGLAIVALVPPAFGQPEQLHEKQAQPQIERQQRDQRQRADQAGPDKEVEE